MHLSTVTTAEDGLLSAVRNTLADADDAFLCVAFVTEPGVRLLRTELKRLGARGRLLATTAGGTTTAAGLDMAARLGLEVRVFNQPDGGLYHPKLYTARAGPDASAVIGSSNLTSGLVSNLEVASHIVGNAQADPLRDAWAWAQSLWEDPTAAPWDGFGELPRDRTIMPARLMDQIRAEASHNPVFLTLGPNPKRNRVTRVCEQGVFLETDRTTAKASGAQLVDAWMFELAWRYLAAHGTLTNKHLLNNLRVHRSSAVCAILARLPGVHVVPGRPIGLVCGRHQANSQTPRGLSSAGFILPA